MSWDTYPPPRPLQPPTNLPRRPSNWPKPSVKTSKILQNGRQVEAVVGGPLCESGDIFTQVQITRLIETVSEHNPLSSHPLSHPFVFEER